MKTIKLPYTCDHSTLVLLKQYNNVLRFSYNRFLEGRTEKEIRLLTKGLNSTNLLNSWLTQCAILDGKAIKARFGEKKVIFGGKPNLVKYLKGKITKDEFKTNRLSPITIQGETLKKGNRSFNLDIIQNNQIIFKQDKKNHLVFQLPSLRPNLQRELETLEILNSVKNSKPGYTYSVKFDLKYLYISFEEFPVQMEQKLNQNRYLGIDLNPDSIGISVLE